VSGIIIWEIVTDKDSFDSSFEHEILEWKKENSAED
jgi:hypothetical protein